MNFNQAIEATRRGELIKRPFWVDKFIFERPEDTAPASAAANFKSLPQKLKDILATKEYDVAFTSYHCVFIDGVVINGWNFPPEEIAAEDWEIV